jgi:hypothetical protein
MQQAREIRGSLSATSCVLLADPLQPFNHAASNQGGERRLLGEVKKKKKVKKVVIPVFGGIKQGQAGGSASKTAPLNFRNKRGSMCTDYMSLNSKLVIVGSHFNRLEGGNQVAMFRLVIEMHDKVCPRRDTGSRACLNIYAMLEDVSTLFLKVTDLFGSSSATMLQVPKGKSLLLCLCSFQPR